MLVDIHDLQQRKIDASSINFNDNLPVFFISTSITYQKIQEKKKKILRENSLRRWRPPQTDGGREIVGKLKQKKNSAPSPISLQKLTSQPQRSRHNNPQHSLLNHLHRKKPTKTPPTNSSSNPPIVPSTWNSLYPNSLPLSLPRLFSRSRSLNRLPDNNPDKEHSYPQPSKARLKAKSTSTEDTQKLLEAVQWSAEVEEQPANFQLRKSLKPLLHFKQIKKKKFQTCIYSRVHPWWPPLFARLGAARKVFGSS